MDRVEHKQKVRCAQGKRRNLFGYMCFVYRCPVCGRQANVASSSAICTGKRIRKERRDERGQSQDFPNMARA